MSELSIDFNIENEQIVLGALLKDPEALDRELPHLRTDLFLSKEHKRLVEALREVRRRGAKYSADTVVQITGEEISLKYLRDLEDAFDVLTEENFKIHVEILEKSRIKYGAVEPFGELRDSIEDPHGSLESVESAALSILRTVREGVRSSSATRSDAAVKAWLHDLEDIRTNRAEKFRPFYFSGLDEVLYEGLKPGSLVVIAGRPGMGKSTLMSNLTARQALRERRVLAVPVEAGKQSVLDQVACAYTEIPAEKLVKTPDELTDEETFAMKRALRKVFGKGNVTFDDEMQTLDDLEIRLEEDDYDLAILDLFEYLIPGRKEPDVITDALRRVRRLAKRRKCAIIVVQQIKRIQRKKKNRPMLTELKNSGGYEEVADLVLLLHRENYYDPNADSDDFLEIQVAKQRRGPQNVTVNFLFQPECCRVSRHEPNRDKAH